MQVLHWLTRWYGNNKLHHRSFCLLARLKVQAVSIWSHDLKSRICKNNLDFSLWSVNILERTEWLNWIVCKSNIITPGATWKQGPFFVKPWGPNNKYWTFSLIADIVSSCFRAPVQSNVTVYRDVATGPWLWTLRPERLLAFSQLFFGNCFLFPLWIFLGLSNCLWVPGMY